MGAKLAALAAIVVALGVATPARGDVPRGFYGVTPQTKLGAADYREMGRGNVGTLRYEMSWSDIEPPPVSVEDVFSERDYRWEEFDPIVNQAARRGVGVLPTVYGTPYWLAQYQGCDAYCHSLGPNTSAAYVAFSLFMTASVERYGPGGEFWSERPNLPYHPIRAWQIWNEQNSSDFWKPEPSASDYAGLLAAGGDAVHAADPGATVLPGGMIGEPAQEGKKTVSGWDFLARLYANPRVRTAFDAIAIHPYGASLRSVKGTIGRWRVELRAARALSDPIWVTEIGWASGGGEHPLNKGLRGQARLIDRTLGYFTAHREELNIANVDIYAWRDAAPGAEQCLWCAKSGLLHYAGRRPKPAWRVFESFTGAR